jgi:hypothetical protein
MNMIRSFDNLDRDHQGYDTSAALLAVVRSLADRSVTGWPFLSRTTTSTRIAVVAALKAWRSREELATWADGVTPPSTANPRAAATKDLITTSSQFSAISFQLSAISYQLSDLNSQRPTPNARRPTPNSQLPTHNAQPSTDG